MSTAKTPPASQDKTPAAPVISKQPETPDKAAGPQHAMQTTTASPAPPPPNDATSVMRSAELLANREGPGAASRARTMTTLQRKVGNNRVASLLGSAIQTKLTVGAVDDPQEREADRVAETIPQQPGSKPASPVLRQFVMKHSLTPAEGAQRQVNGEKQEPNEDAEANHNAAADQDANANQNARQDDSAEARKNDAAIQREEASNAAHGGVEADMERRIASPDVGKPLPEALRGQMEAGLGSDFSQVRVHDTAEDQADARRLNAKAFTHGEHIWLGAGESANDHKLMAHELTHVVQQQASAPLDRDGEKDVARATAQPRSIPDTPRPAESVAGKVTATQDASRLPAVTNAAAAIGQSGPSITSATAANAAPTPEGNQAGAQPAIDANGNATRTGDAASHINNEGGQPETGTASENNLAAPSKSPTEELPSSQTRETEKENKESIEGAQKQAGAKQAEAVTEAQSVAAELETAPMPSLASLIEPGPEEASGPRPEEPAGSAMPGRANSPNVSRPSTTEVSRAPIARSVAVAKLPDQAEESSNELDAVPEANGGPGHEPANDPMAGRTAMPRLVGMLTSASVASQVRLQQQAETTKATLTENAEALRQQVHAQIHAAVASLRAAFASERAALQASIQETRGQVATALETRRAEALSQGEEAKGRLRDLFTQQQSDVSETVEASVSDVEEIRNSGVSRATQRTREQATTARHEGDRKNASYPATERGEAQGEAALAVAQETAQEMENRLPDTIEAIGDIVEDIPDEFREKGEEALTGIDEGLPDLLTRVDEQVQAVVTALDNQATQANEQLDLLENQVMAQLESAENAGIAQAEALGPQSEAQIEAGLETAFSHLDVSVPQAGDQIQQIVDQAVEMLNEIESPNVEGANEMVQQILRFVTGATDETIAAQQEAGVRMVEEFSRIDQATADGLMNVEQATADQLPALSDSVNSSLSDLVVQLNDGFDRTITGMDEAFLDTEDQVRTQLNQSIQQLAIDFSQTLQDAGAEVTTAVDEGLANNDEALAQLSPQMNEAADDAAWDYDHPILSTIRDIGAIVLGVIAGILLVIALVVVAIVAFKLLIAGLIAIGVSAAIAKVIAVVIGLGLLAYGIYRAYQARIERGEEGGWGTLGGALLDITGISDIRRAFTEEGLSPFERGFAFGRGIATVATFFLGRRLNRQINSRLPRSITNPSRGAGLRWIRERLGGSRAGKGLPGLPKSAPRVLGRGNTGRTTPNNLNEQIAMEQARANPAAGSPVPLRQGMTDPRWPASEGWVKMRQNINGVEIHYVRNTRTGAVDDFKFK